VKSVIWMNLEGAHTKVSNKACALLFQLMLNIDEQNTVHKTNFFKTVKWIKDRRTANKYWKELVENDVIVHLDRKIWMVSPFECFSQEDSRDHLVTKWEEVKSIN